MWDDTAGSFHLSDHFSPLPIIDTGSVKQKLFFLAVLEANTQLKHRCVCLTGTFAMEILSYYPGTVMSPQCAAERERGERCRETLTSGRAFNDALCTACWDTCVAECGKQVLWPQAMPKGAEVSDGGDQAKSRQWTPPFVTNWHHSGVYAAITPGWWGRDGSRRPASLEGQAIFHSAILIQSLIHSQRRIFIEGQLRSQPWTRQELSPALRDAVASLRNLGQQKQNFKQKARQGEIGRRWQWCEPGEQCGVERGQSMSSPGPVLTGTSAKTTGPLARFKVCEVKESQLSRKQLTCHCMDRVWARGARLRVICPHSACCWRAFKAPQSQSLN